MTQYGVTLTPSGGGAPITSTSTTPAVVFQNLTAGTQVPTLTRVPQLPLPRAHARQR